MSSAIRPAATVAILRDHPEHGLQVFLVKRSSRSAFMPSAHVFPGGRVDPEDAEVQVEGGERDRVRMGETFGAPAHAYQVAAVRETLEEAQLQLRVADLVYFAWWITPRGEPRRYDTRFFLAGVEGGDHAIHDDFEVVDSAWDAPSGWLEAFDQGRVVLAPPTWRTLWELAGFQTVSQALEHARELHVVPIEPRGRKTDDGFVVLLPGDPEYPSERPVQGPTRHELRAGRWFIHR